MPRGGYREPSNPAPASGPGALSRRTDGGQPVRVAPGGDYGDRQELQRLQQAAPLATGMSPDVPGDTPGLDLSQIVGLGEQSTSPDTPVTAGAAIGPGPGLDALGARAPVQADSEFLRRYWPVLAQAAQRDDAAPSLKKFARILFTQM